MLFPSDSAREQLLDVAKQRAEQEIEPAIVAHELLALEPEFAQAYAVLGTKAIQAGDWEEAERCFWKGLALDPFGALQLNGLAQVYRRNTETQAASDLLWCLTLWAVALGDEINVSFADSMEAEPDSEFDYRDPETYRILAELQESKLKPEDVPAELQERIRPYWLLKQLAQGAIGSLPMEVLRDIRAQAPTCVPVLHAALRAWARDPGGTNPVGLLLIVALLGELAGPEVLSDLWELSNLRDNAIFLHAHWALCRMAVRYPEETIESILAALPDAATGQRCGMVEHLGLMEKSEGAPAAILALMKGFSQRAKEHDASYLLLAAADALAELGHAPRSPELFAQYERLLTKEGRQWIREMLDDPAGFVPRIVEEELPDFDIEDVCLSRVLMDDEDDFDEDDEEDDEDDAFEEPETPVVKPGRNDPCWCGSGKKYKKCHLEADEEAARAEHEPQDPVRTEAMGGLLDTAERIHKRRDMMEAAHEYFGHDVYEEDMTSGAEGFFLWYLYDFRPKSTGLTVVEQHLRRHGAEISPETREVLEAWRDSRYGLFEVRQAAEDSSGEITDLYAGDTVKLTTAETLDSAGPGDYILARVETWGGHTNLSADLLTVPPESLAALRQFIETEAEAAGQPPAQFMRGNIHRLHRVLEDLGA